MNCRRVTSLITEYLSGALDAWTTSALGAHLLDCCDCLALFETYLKTIEAVRTLPSKDISPGVRTRIHRSLEKRIKYSSLVH